MNKLILKYPFLGSSADKTKLSATIESLLLALVPIIIALAQVYNFDLSENDLLTAIKLIVGIISGAGLLFGVIRKIYNANR